jgi:hypothetical protein
VGLYLVLAFAFGWPLLASTPALMQVHGQVQAVGFVVLFVIAVGVQLFPRFLSARLERPYLVSTGGLVLAIGVLLRVLGQPLALSETARASGLVVSGVLELTGAAVCLYAYAGLFRRSVQPVVAGLAGLLPLTAAASLLLALAVNLVSCVDLARGGLVVPFAHDEAILHLELWGFVSSVVLAVGGRIFPRFLLLRPTRERVIPTALGLWALGSLGTPLSWMLLPAEPWSRLAAALAQMLGGLAFVYALRLYEPPLRASGTPHVTDPTRLWVRCAFGLLLLAATINLGLAAAEALGSVASLTQRSAARHALAQGFVLPLIVVMAARILPGYSGEMLHRPRLLAFMVWSILVGAVSRVLAELVGGYAPGWGAIVALGGSLAVCAFVMFAVGLWRATGRAPALARG